MSSFAQLDENNVVTRVIAIEQDLIDTGLWGEPSSFIQTSYNTLAGRHLLGGTPLRKNYAGIGYIYDSTRDAFYEPQPYPSWTLNEDSCIWEPPTPMPIDGKPYQWDENTTNWVEITQE